MISKHAFTLVELLVVVTIIVILLAMLTPAMDKAIYQAELAECAAQLKAIASTSTTYAAESRRHYPHRNWGSASSYKLSWTLAQVDVGYDIRETLEGYISTDMLLDPLAPKVDLSPEETGPTDLVLGPYTLWFSFKYTYGEAMNRMGDRMSYATTANGTKTKFSVLAGCYDSISEQAAAPRAFNAHPDFPRTMYPHTQQATPAGPTLAACRNCSVTDTRWTVATTWERRQTDQNIAFTDNAVVRYAQKPWDAVYVDGRWAKVGTSAAAITTELGGWYVTLPK